jgi:hypothetical protein
LDSDSKSVLLCEQCALTQAREAEIEAGGEPQPTIKEDGGPCATCAELKEQEESAAREWADCKDLPDRLAAEAARRKWEHLFRARCKHQFKEHNSDLRGRA